MHGRRGWWLVAIVAVGAAWPAREAAARRSAARWLMAARAADQRCDWYGLQQTQVQMAGRTLTSRVRLDHRAPGSTRREYLDGELAGCLVLQEGRQQWRCDPRLGWALASAAPEDLPLDLRGWRARLTRGQTVAGRRTVLVRLERRELRRELWLDRETGLLLRMRMRRAGQATDTWFSEFSLGRRAEEVDFTPPVGPQRSLSEVHPGPTQLVATPPREPTWLPRGYRRLPGEYRYHCPCGCGMVAAHLVYSDGLNQVSVFYLDPAHAGCALSDGCCREGGAQVGCVLSAGAAGPLVARFGPERLVVVMGDLPNADLARIAGSVPGVTQTR